MDGSVNLGQRDREIYIYLICLVGIQGWRGGYNSLFIPDRGTEQHRKISRQVRLFTEGRSKLRKYSNFL